MALTHTITAGPLTASQTWDVTNAQADKRLSLFILGWAGPMPEGLTAAQQGQWKLDQAQQKLVDWFKAEVARNAEIAEAAQIEALRVQIRADASF